MLLNSLKEHEVGKSHTTGSKLCWSVREQERAFHEEMVSSQEARFV